MKLNLVILMFFLSFTESFSQGTWGAQTFGTLSWYDPYETENKTHLAIGYGGGISAIMPIKEKWLMRQQVNFQTRRYTIETEEIQETPNSISRQTNKDRINENLLDLFTEFIWESKSGIGISFGPRFGIGMSRINRNEFYSSYTDLINGFTNELKSKSKVNGYSDYREVSLCMGASYKFSDQLRIEGRFQQSLLVFDETNTSTEKWALVQLGISYVFIKKKTD
jgi:hypothetical protein